MAEDGARRFRAVEGAEAGPGDLVYRTWEAQDGSKRSKVDVTADQVQFLGGKNGSGGGSGSGSGTRGGQRGAAEVDLEEMEDIPFKIGRNARTRIVEGIH